MPFDYSYGSLLSEMLLWLTGQAAAAERMPPAPPVYPVLHPVLHLVLHPLCTPCCTPCYTPRCTPMYVLWLCLLGNGRNDAAAQPQHPGKSRR